MKMSIERLRSRWRTVVTTAFVLIAFTAPSTKGIFGKIFNVYATGGNNGGNNNHQNSQNNSSAVRFDASYAMVWRRPGLLRPVFDYLISRMRTNNRVRRLGARISEIRMERLSSYSLLDGSLDALSLALFRIE